MDCTPYTLDRLVNELREARAASPDPGAIIGRIRSIAERAAVRHREWLREDMCEPDAEQGFGFHLLHEEAGHELAVFVATWLPGRGTPPHDHGTWAVVVGLKGCERNTRWRRLDDSARPGYAEIAPAEERLIGAGDIVTMRSGVIHSVRNEGVGLSVSLHVYGRHVNYTNRSQFDPVGRRETPYKVATKGRSSAGSSTPFAGANHDR